MGSVVQVYTDGFGRKVARTLTSDVDIVTAPVVYMRDMSYIHQEELPLRQADFDIVRNYSARTITLTIPIPETIDETPGPVDATPENARLRRILLRIIAACQEALHDLTVADSLVTPRHRRWAAMAWLLGLSGNP